MSCAGWLRRYSSCDRPAGSSKRGLCLNRRRAIFSGVHLCQDGTPFGPPECPYGRARALLGYKVLTLNPIETRTPCNVNDFLPAGYPRLREPRRGTTICSVRRHCSDSGGVLPACSYADGSGRAPTVPSVFRLFRRRRKRRFRVCFGTIAGRLKTVPRVLQQRGKCCADCRLWRRTLLGARNEAPATRFTAEKRPCNASATRFSGCDPVEFAGCPPVARTGEQAPRRESPTSQHHGQNLRSVLRGFGVTPEGGTPSCGGCRSRI